MRKAVIVKDDEVEGFWNINILDGNNSEFRASSNHKENLIPMADRLNKAFEKIAVANETITHNGYYVRRVFFNEELRIIKMDMLLAATSYAEARKFVDDRFKEWNGSGNPSDQCGDCFVALTNLETENVFEFCFVCDLMGERLLDDSYTLDEAFEVALTELV